MTNASNDMFLGRASAQHWVIDERLVQLPVPGLNGIQLQDVQEWGNADDENLTDGSFSIYNFFISDDEIVYAKTIEDLQDEETKIEEEVEWADGSVGKYGALESVLCLIRFDS